MQRLTCQMISLAGPGTSTGVLEVLLNITPIEEFLLAEAVRGSSIITVSGLWHANPVVSFGKTKSHVDVCNEARGFLPLLQIPADRMKKTNVFERNFEFEIMDKKNAFTSESILNPSTIKGLHWWLEPRWESGCGFLYKISKHLPKPSIFPPWNTQHCLPSRSPSYFRSGKGRVFGKNAQSTYCCAGR